MRVATLANGHLELATGICLAGAAGSACLDISRGRSLHV